MSLNVKIILNNQVKANWLKLVVNTSISSIVDDFMLVIPLTETNNVQVGNTIQIEINNKIVFTGIVEGWNSIQSQNNNEYMSDLAVYGRSLGLILADSNVPNINIQSIKSVSQLVSTIANKLSNKLQIVSEIDSPINDTVIIPSITENAYQFCKMYTDRAGILMISNANGGITLWRNTKTNINNNSLVIDKSTFTNLHYKTDDRYSNYTAIDQFNGSVFTSASSSDTGAVSGKQLTIYSKLPSSQSELATFVNWVANVNRSQSLHYQIKLAYDPNANFSCGQTIKVNDVYNGINGVMMISKVSYSFSINEGATFILTLTYPDAYTLNASFSGGFTTKYATNN